ncbi:MAG: tetratricopeptide repeat protein [Planctomycetota bacterium]|nr:tetratricopeptide repeat protein [Planctomycetota bacterium]
MMNLRLRFLVTPVFLLVACGLACSDEDDSQLKSARAAYRTGRYAEAETLCKSILERAASDTEAAELLGLVYLETGKHAEARRALKGFEASGADGARVLGVLAEVHFESGDLEAAEKQARKAIELDKNALRAHLVLAQALIDTGRHDDANREMEFFVDYYNEKDEFTDADELTLVARGSWLYGIRMGEKGTVKKVAEELLYKAARLDKENADTFIRWGLCYLEKHDPGEARKKMESALKINPAHALAHYGKALCVGPQDNPQMKKMEIEHALETNPRFVPALQLRALEFIEPCNYSAAKRVLKEALRIDPASQISRGMLAACHFLLDEQADFDRECATVAGINPRCGRFFLTVADIVSMKLRLANAHSFYERAADLDKQLWEARIGVGMSYLRLGEMEKGTACLKEAYERDPFHVWTVNTLKLLDLLETEFITVTSEHFTFRFHEGEKALLPQFAVPLAERAFKEMSERYGFTPRAPILIEVYPRHKDFSVRTFGLPGLGALGVCFGRVVAIDSPRAQEAMGPFSWGAVTWHELAHVFHLQYTDFRVPRWFTEGLATFEEQFGGVGWEREKQLQILDAFEKGLLVAIDNIDRGQTGPAGDLTVYYLYGSLICEYILKEHGFPKIVEMLKLWKERVKTPEVIKRALGMTTSELDYAMHKYVEHWLRDVNVLRPENPELLPALEARLTREPDNLELMTDIALILVSQNKIARAEELAMRVLEQDPVSVNAMICLARVFSEKVREDRAAEYLRRAVAHGADDAGTFLTLARQYLKENDTANAVRHFKLAKTAFPGGPWPGGNPYIELADIYKKDANEDKELAELEAYAKIDSVDFGVRMRLAKLYRKRGRIEDIVRVLEQGALVQVRDIEMQAYLGEALKDLGKDDGAVTAFQATLVLLEEVNKDGKKNMLISDYYCKLAESYISLGENDKALEAAKEARGRYPQNEKAIELIKKLTQK